MRHSGKMLLDGLRNFNSHTPHGVRLSDIKNKLVLVKISTHTPHTGCDLIICLFAKCNVIISTHTPHTGCDSVLLLKWSRSILFQLTHPTRGATAIRLESLCKLFDFNSHTPHGVRPELFANCSGLLYISTHTPHTGCDFSTFQYPYHGRNFNSHTPHGVRRRCRAFLQR